MERLSPGDSSVQVEADTPFLAPSVEREQEAQTHLLMRNVMNPEAARRVESRRRIRRLIRGSLIALTVAAVLTGLILIAKSIASDHRVNFDVNGGGDRDAHPPFRVTLKPPPAPVQVDPMAESTILPPMPNQPSNPDDTPRPPSEPDKTFAPVPPEVLKCEAIDQHGTYLLKPMRADVACVRIIQEGYKDKDVPVEVHPEHNRMVFYLHRTLDDHEKFTVFLFSQYDLSLDKCTAPIPTNYNSKVFISVICPSNHGDY
jgi:hypothetical protein